MVVYKGIKLDLSLTNIYNHIKNVVDIIEYLATTKGITEITIETFLSNGLLSNNQLVKVLGRGTLNSKVTISAHGFSAAAITAIEAQGGICSKI